MSSSVRKYLADNSLPLARDYFGMALELAPQCEAALRGMETIEKTQ